uniref:4Fe-4S ferredoxin-type domain-containing protein n=2 Tax=Chloropicon roscoffensis TaxID=1461544 RepID=A0A7S3FQT5_9CHLO|mmetsp:Transcript_5381/g.16233  ORF Transcript_5381/g.16233 Transcript_5381/m.16233 type:complete len:457 (+) Transcript_5381:63-1433(+)
MRGRALSASTASTLWFEALPSAGLLQRFLSCSSSTSSSNEGLSCHLQGKQMAGSENVGLLRGQRRRGKKKKKKSDVFSDTDAALPEEASTWLECRELVRRRAKEIGLGPTRFARCEAPRRDRMDAYRTWVASGMHGEMSYLSRQDRLDRREDPKIVLEGARSIIVSSVYYWPGKSGFPWNRTTDPSRPRGKVSSYAWGDDYHSVLGAKLRDLASYAVGLCGGNSRWYVDTGAVMERDLAERSGLSFTGKNTMAIHPKFGSGFFIGSVFTTLPLPPDEPLKRDTYCGSCDKCQVACPTGALSQDRSYVLDARRCISYLTIELKTSIPEELRPLVGTWVYGCDICQEVCPWNAFDWRGGGSPLWPNPPQTSVSNPDLLDLLRMGQTEFEERFRGSAVRRIGRDRLLRNVAVALGNAGGLSALPALRRAVEVESDLVAEHASWACRRILEREGTARDDE